MDYKTLATKLREFSEQRAEDDPNKEIYRVVSEAIEQDTFVKLLTEDDRRMLDQIGENYDRNVDINWIYSNQPGILARINSVYFSSLAYLNDRRKNISYFEKKTKDLDVSISQAQENINHINETAKLISGATVLSEYAKVFDSEADNHNTEAKKWLSWLVGSIVGLFVILTVVFFVEISELPIVKNALSGDIKDSEYFNIFALSIKAALVLAYLQIPGFIKRNYFAEKHLEQTYLHRRNVLRSLHAVYNSLNDAVEKDKIITVGATIAFSENESGYITRKEGAGDEDLTPTLLSVFKK